MDSVLFVIAGFLAGFGFYRHIILPRALEFTIQGLAGKKIMFKINKKTYRIEINEEN